jgi:hypothetical protein
MKAAAFRRTVGLLPGYNPVGPSSTSIACPLRSTSITPASSLLRGSPPLSCASVLLASRLEPLVPFPSSLVQLRIAVWTGVTRDTRPVAGAYRERVADHCVHVDGGPGLGDDAIACKLGGVAARQPLKRCSNFTRSSRAPISMASWPTSRQHPSS